MNNADAGVLAAFPTGQPYSSRLLAVQPIYRKRGAAAFMSPASAQPALVPARAGGDSRHRKFFHFASSVFPLPGAVLCCIGISKQEAEQDVDSELQRLTSRIVSAYVANNTVAAQDLPPLIQSVFTALNRAGAAPADVQPAEVQKPAVPIRKSVTPDRIVCLECGKAQKMLRRHIGAEHAMTVDEYRAKWGLPDDYPMTAPNYAAARSEMAKAIGLGRKKGSRKAK